MAPSDAQKKAAAKYHKENIKNLISKNGKEMTIKAALKKKYKKADNEDEQK